MYNLDEPIELILQRKAGRAVARVLSKLVADTVAGASPRDIDAACRRYAAREGALTVYLFEPINFPTSICVSVNAQIAHTAATSDRAFKAGDLVKLDLVLSIGGQHADAAVTVIVAEHSLEGQLRKSLLHLTHHTREALKLSLAAIRPGVDVGVVGRTIATYLERVNRANRTGLVLEAYPQLGGHGIGTEMHMPPMIPNTNDGQAKTTFEEGKSYAIEPIIYLRRTDQEPVAWRYAGNHEASPAGTMIPVLLSNFRDADYLSAHEEHTVHVTREGAQVLTTLA